MQSKAKTVAEYLAELPEDRREAIMTVRQMLLANLDKQIEEGMQYGMIGFYVPHSVYPPGYHCDPKLPLGYVCLASQKNYMSLYIMCLYFDAAGEKAFREEWAKTGKKLDMGKCCIRFKRVEDLALDLIAQRIRDMPTKKYIAFYESVLKTPRTSPAKPAKKTASKATVQRKTATKKATGKQSKSAK